MLPGRGQFGFSVALSSEGNTALIGGLAYNGNTGAAWVFTRSGSTWTQQGPKLTGTGEIGAGEFGSSVALSSTGNTALIGGFRDNAGAGAAWVFTRSGSVWTQQGEKLVAKSGEEVGPGEFGTSVALSAEGTTTYALIGSPAESYGIFGHYGSAWVFTRTGTTWTQQGGKLQNPSGEVGEGEFGDSAALSSEGNTALIGGPGDNAKVGAAWVFTRSGTTWTQQGGKLTGSGEVGAAEFGATSAALSSSGNTALLGGPEDNKDVGAAWAFTRSGTTWTQQGEKLTGSGEVGEGEFGFSVALSANGYTALMGGPNDNANVGAAWVFTHSGSAWTQFGSKLTGGGEAGEGAFGNSVALSSEGNTALMGGFSDNKGVGAGWVFVNTSPTVETKPASVIAQTTVTLNASVNPDGGEVSKCEFEYGTTNAYGSTAPCSSLPGSGSSPVAVSAAITGLTANTTYHFRISATNPGGVNKGSDETFKTLPNAPTVVTKPASPIAQTTATLTATVNPNSGEVSKCEFEYGTTIAYGSTAPCSSLPGSGSSPVAVTAAITGLTANTTYHFRISATNPGGTGKGSDEPFKTLPNAPTVVTKAASAVTQTTATLNATVNPNAGEVSECKFEYGTTIAYGQSASCSSLPGSGSSPVAVTAAITGLTANATYHFRISATNAGGTSKGSDETFTALPNAPTVVTKPASAVAPSSATLNATVNPNGGEVSECKFEYGTTIAYGQTASCSSLPGSGSSPVAVTAAITGLSVNTTYHFRISATNAGGTSKGSDEPFKTAPGAPTAVTGAASSISQTSATLNATVNPNGGAVSVCVIEFASLKYYEETKSYEEGEECASLPGSGTSPVPVSAPVGGLAPNTTYVFRIVAENPSGRGEGSNQSFTTLRNPPTVVTKAASSVTQTAATLNATVNPNGGTVSECKFEYGTTEAYGSSASCSSLPGSGESPVAVTAAITGLTANTTYHFRISATNAGGTSKGSDEPFKTLPNAPTVVTKPASSLAQTSATLNATVNPNGGTVSECKFEYGTTEAYGSSASCSSLPGSGSSPVAVTAAITGLTANTTYHFRISATNAGGTGKGSDEPFKTLPNAPTVVTKAASAVTQTTATLNATVNPNAGEVSECKFEYGTTIAYGQSASCSSLPGSGSSPVAVTAAITGLTANTTYHFRISATNAGGTSKGSDETFKAQVPTPPSVVTGSASSVGSGSATLNATVNPNGGEVNECKFEYGTTIAYGQSAPCASLPGSGTSPVAVSAAATELAPTTTYHFRVSATNAGGTSKGSDAMFVTLLAPHYFSNGVRLEESNGQPEEEGAQIGVSWGTLELKGESGAAAGGTVTCHTVAAGADYNPIGGGAGKGSTGTFAAFACQGNICKAGEATSVVPASLPWPSELTGTSTATFRIKSGTPVNPVRMSVTCNGTATAPFEGEDQPLGPSGLRKGSSAKAPSEIEFDSGSGELKLVSTFGGTVVGSSAVIGSLKTIGYENQELIQVK